MIKNYFTSNNSCFIAFFLFLSFFTFGQTTQTFNSSGTYTVPAGVTSITVQAWGGGGAGGGTTGNATAVGGGGGGGAYRTAIISVTPGSVINYTVGVGGTGNSGNNGGNGGTTTFSTVSANGGTGGTRGNSNAGAGGAGGTGGTYSGGAGRNGNLNNYGGGGGSSAGTAANGNTATTAAGATAPTAGGNGGDGGTGYWFFANIGVDGSDGVSPGGGGGGADNGDVFDRSGGNGAAGRIIISFVCPASAGTLSGNQYLCTYGTTSTTFSSTVSGGTWSSNNTSVATVNSTTGVVTSVAAGTATITYTMGGGSCPIYTATRVVYISSGPGSGPTSLSGSSTQCVNSTTTYTIVPDVFSSSYIWSYEGTGATITPAADGLSASVTFGSSATSGNIRVQSINGCGNGGGGRYLYVAIVPTPLTPSTSGQYGATCTGFTAQWGYSNHATSYRIDVATDNSFTNIIPTYNNYNAGNVTELNLTGLNPGTTYYYRVRGVNSCGTGSNSNIMSYSTTSLPASIPVVTGGSNSCNSGLNLNWNQVTDATGYYLDISTNSSFSSFVSGYNGFNVGYQTSNVYVGGLATGVLYYYRIRAYNSCGTTESSNVMSFSLGSVGGTASSSQIICSGTSPSDLNLSGYNGSVIRWEKSTDNGFSSPTIISNNSDILLGTTIGSLSTTTYFRAVVQNGSCTTAYSSTVTITVSTAAITTTPVTICAGGSGSLTASSGCAGSPISTSATNAGSGTNVTGIGTVNWGNPDRIVSDNNSNASASVNNNTITTNYLQGNDFGFSIPLNATITGIQVSINRYSTQNQTTARYVQDNEVKLIKSNVIIGDNKAVAGNWSTTASTVANYGATTDLWGATWTPADINDANFGVALAVDIRRNGNGTTTANVDNIEITVTYTIGNVEWYTTSSGGSPIATGTSFNPVGVSGSGLANTNTAGTTTYYAACSTNPGCRVAANFVINSIPNIGAIIAPSALCSGDSLNPTAPTVTSNGSTVTASGWELETTVGGGTYANLTVPYTVAFADNSKRIRYYATTSCGTTYSNLVTITVNPPSSAPVVGTITHPTCAVSTGSVVLSGLPATGTWTINPGGQTGSGTETTISGLASGTYNFTVTLSGACTSAATANVVINNPPGTNTWTGSWSNGTPTIEQRVIFNADYNSTTDSPTPTIEACSCRVNNADVVIASGHTLKVVNDVDVQVNGTLTFENNASLVQINDDAVNTGNINYKRHTAPVKRYDFTYWSSPVTGQTLKALSPNTLGDKYYSYNPNTGWKIEYNGALTMQPGNGYIIRAPQTFSITVASVDMNPTFIGTPNNGVITLPSLVGNRVHLLGNPYPSAIDADKFIDANTGVLEGTLYFWTHNSPPSNAVVGDAIYNYTTNDYATYNRTGGVGTAPAKVDSDSNDPNDNNNLSIPTGEIAAGQGFFAPAQATGNVVFNNSMRLGVGGVLLDNSQFFKLNTNAKTAKGTTTTEKNRIWLNLTNAEGAFKQTLVGYISGATNNYDAGFDGITYDGNSFIDFYSINNALNLSIQGRALPFVKQDTVALGYRSTIQGEFKISIDKLDGVLSTAKIFLEDKDLQVLHDLKASDYSFSTTKGVFNNRFVLRYVDKNAIEEVSIPDVTDDTVDINTKVLVSVKQGAVTIRSSASSLKKVGVYDVRGRCVYLNNSINSEELLINSLNSSHQVLIVYIILENGKKQVQKIIY